MDFACHLWLGLSYGEGWKYDDGTPFDYANWAPGEPTFDGSCVQQYNRHAIDNGVEKADVGQWNDNKCFAPMQVVCEKRASFVSCSKLLGMALTLPSSNKRGMRAMARRLNPLFVLLC